MAVVNLGIDPGSRTAENDLGVRTYSDTYKVEASSPADSAYDVGSAAGLPVIGSTYSDDSAAYCRSLSVANPEPYAGWTVTASYSTERTISTSDPSLDGVLVSWSSEIYQEPIFVDKDGDAVVNSAGDYFVDPVPTRQSSHLIAKIRANLLTIPTWVLSYQNAVNNASVTIDGLSVAIRKAKVQRIEIGEEQLRNGTVFRQLSYEVHLRNDDWKLRPLDAGFRSKNGSNDMLQIINDGDGSEVTQPALLDGSGARLDNPTPATAVFGEYEIYPELDLTSLPGIT